MNERFQLIINGEYRNSLSDQWFDAENPFDGECWAQVPRCNEDDVSYAVNAAKQAFESGEWPTLSATQRGGLLIKAGQLIRQRAERLATLETKDTGKRFAESLPQMTGIADWFDYYGGLADKVQGQVIPSNPELVVNYTVHEPLGVVAAITPWNSPIMIAVWKIAPALAAGNTVIVKPSEHASTSTLALMEVFRDAGFPPGVVNVITGFPAECGQALVTHPDVAKVTFTGSDNGGRIINTQAAESFKRVTMELGGKSPQLIFDDAMLENAVHGVISGIFLSNGQTCVAGSRVYLQSSIKEQFLNCLRDKIQNLKMGDPFDAETRIGPIANTMQFERIKGFLEETIASGATCIAGGKVAQGDNLGRGHFIEPTIFADVDPTSRVACEEVFGPVLTVFEFDTEDQALELANNTPYGLAAGVWTSNIPRAMRLSRKIRSGTVYINTYRAVSVASPVGGYKKSGFGRENGIEAIYEYLQTKSIWLGTQDVVPNPLT
jgi:(Z)-2-((N-methylformamido)methylene)-5-hydroxybutyrolactone dehydrogenase